VLSKDCFKARINGWRSSYPDKKGDKYAGTHGNGQYPINNFPLLYSVKNNFLINIIR
jgi:hypothetical protein